MLLELGKSNKVWKCLKFRDFMMTSVLFQLQLQELTRENIDLQSQLEASSTAEQRMFQAERQKVSAKVFGLPSFSEFYFLTSFTNSVAVTPVGNPEC